MIGDTYYRLREEAHWEDGLMTIRTEKHRVVRLTPKGVWIVPYYGTKERFVLNGEGKRFAYPTMEAAKASFIARKSRQIGHLEQQLTFARAALNHATTGGFTLDKPFHDETLDQFHSY